MNINSLFFIFIFLPLSVGLYYIVKDKYKPVIMLVLSIIFYSLNSLAFLPVIIALCIMDVIIGRRMAVSGSRKKGLLIFGVTVNVLVIAFYKVINSFFGAFIPTDGYFSELLSFPIGLSFFIFKSISYIADSYSGLIKPTDSLVSGFLYLTFFPQIQSGPISRFSDMQYKKADINSLSSGTCRFLIGFCKKVLLADVFASTVNPVFASSLDTVSPLCAWIASVCWSLQLYYDFSGYSDMAIGISGLFGYSCPENFNYPYTTKSISMFWRKWHITLGAWFRDYVYIPMGGSRVKTKAKLLFNLFIVWILTGFWHGAAPNFIVWGIAYFLLIGSEKVTGLPDRIKSAAGRIVYRIFALTAINILWVIFRCDSLNYGLGFIGRMFSFGYNSPFFDIRSAYILKNIWTFLIAGIVFCMPTIPFFTKICSKNKGLQNVLCFVRPLIIIMLFVLSLSIIVSGVNNPFAYANF